MQGLFESYENRRVVLSGNGWTKQEFRRMSQIQRSNQSPSMVELTLRGIIADLCPEHQGLFFILVRKICPDFPVSGQP